ncbi:GINS complex, Psf1 component [Piedraia hortae CBS 480.64]|uniref:DNA replication complex GINS protein PSF1 n=1 Tax=Piedraia hortae CBS 480.64 TaxID=1314780 RepID=A0A6A7BXP7_9PEZI|nr:GINS complex, Psf1 component [Piedraia hortae CBS 480.64]
MYGDTCLPLMNETVRLPSLPQLPPYNSGVVRTSVKEVRDLDGENMSLLSPFNSSHARSSQGIQSSGFVPSQDPATACALLVNHLAMRRNKRCLLAYHRGRVEKIEGTLWGGSGGANHRVTAARVPSGAQGTPSTANLSSEEEQYMQNYGNLLAAMKGAWTEIDLTGDLAPPRDVHVDVRVLKDAGEIQTEYGSLSLVKNSQLFVRLLDVEGLIERGFLERI